MAAPGFPLVPSYTAAISVRRPPSHRGTLIDSIFRAYPVPPIFLQEITTNGLKGPSSVYEIVDGQQRILSLSEFLQDSFETLDAEDKRLRLPNSLRSANGLGADSNSLACLRISRLSSEKLL